MSMPNYITLQNGPKTRSTFSVKEMSRRLQLLRQHMTNTSLDAIVLSSIHNINYFGDFLFCEFGRSYALVVTHDSSILITTNIDGGQGYRRSWGDNLVYTDWKRDNYFVALRKAIPLKSRRIGVEFDHLSLDKFRKVEAALDNAELIGIAPGTNRIRMFKSTEEIQLIRIGAAVADVGGAACLEAISEGVPEYEVALAGTAAMTREIAKRMPYCELRDTWTWFQSGLNTDGAHNPVTSRRVKSGDILSVNCFPMIAGYFSSLERTAFLGEPNAQQRRIWEINCKVHQRGQEIIRPGVRCCDIAAELNEIYLQADLLNYRTFGYGHSNGVLCHYYGREAGLELREDIETVLETGMVVSMTPMVMLPEGTQGAGGYREGSVLIVNDRGAENITKLGSGPEHNIINLP